MLISHDLYYGYTHEKRVVLNNCVHKDNYLFKKEEIPSINKIRSIQLLKDSPDDSRDY